MFTVWKFEFEVEDEVVITMPAEAIVLSVGTQKENAVCIWAKVDDSQTRKEERKFYVRGTGHPIGKMEFGAKFLGTVIDSPFVWHVFGAN